MKDQINYNKLRQIGLEYIQKVSGKVWTDYGTHDPGITILEQLCFALVDLGYRSLFDICDILTPNNTNNIDFTKSFFPAEEILPGGPVSTEDYRKIVLEHFSEQINNVEFKSVPRQIKVSKSKSFRNGPQCRYESINGFYNVIVELKPDKPKDDLGTKLLEFLQQHRNLCEQFRTKAIEFKQHVKIGIICRLDIDRECDYNIITRQIEESLRKYISPSINYYTLEQLLQKGYQLDEILQTELPCYDKLIDKQELKNFKKKNVLYASDVKNLILSIKGVNNISFLKFVVENNNYEKFCKIDPEYIELLDTSKVFSLHNFTFKSDDINQIIYVINNFPFVLGKHMDYTPDKSTFSDSKNTQTELTVPRPKGTYRDLDKYYSFQNEMPECYCIGHEGISENASTERKIQRLQLKAYLSFFDQILADYLCQLRSIGELLSWKDNNKTYFNHVLSEQEILDISKVVDSTNNNNSNSNNNNLLRKNAILNHLLARFNEKFSDIALINFFDNDNKKANNKDNSNDIGKIIEYKREFLCRYADLSANRSKSIDIASTSNKWKSSKTEERIMARLGLLNMLNKPLTPKKVSKGGIEVNMLQLKNGAINERKVRLENNAKSSFGTTFGVRLIEHSLLLPTEMNAYTYEDFLTFYDNSGKNIVNDPYSNQVTAICPGWLEITHNSHFRKIVEQVIREEIPAHLSLKVCWISQESMLNVEQCYTNYISKIDYKVDDVKKSLQMLIIALNRMHNIYPPSLIFEYNNKLISALTDSITQIDYSVIGE